MMRALLPILTALVLCLGRSAWAEAVVEAHVALGKQTPFHMRSI